MIPSRGDAGGTEGRRGDAEGIREIFRHLEIYGSRKQEAFQKGTLVQ